MAGDAQALRAATPKTPGQRGAPAGWPCSWDGMSMAALDASIANVGGPSIEADLGTRLRLPVAGLPAPRTSPDSWAGAMARVPDEATAFGIAGRS